MQISAGTKERQDALVSGAISRTDKIGLHLLLLNRHHASLWAQAKRAAQMRDPALRLKFLAQSHDAGDKAATLTLSDDPIVDGLLLGREVDTDFDDASFVSGERKRIALLVDLRERLGGRSTVFELHDVHVPA